MKKYISPFLLLIICITTALAQSPPPQGFNYQAVVRDAFGVSLPNQHLSLRFTVHSASETGPVLYSETDTATSNANGIFTVIMGGGDITPGSGTFDSINWGIGPVYLQVEMNINGGTNYFPMGTSQLLSVPYALYAGHAANGVAGPPGPAGPSVTATAFNTNGSVSVITGVDTVTSANAVWTTKGNSGIDPTNFIGTTDTTDVIFKRNNIEGMRLKADSTVSVNGKMGIGVLLPKTTLDVNGAITVEASPEPITTSGGHTIAVANRGFILINSNQNASSVLITLGPGSSAGQVVMFSDESQGSSNNGVRFTNNASMFNTKLGAGMRDLLNGSVLIMMWNGYNWLEISFSGNQ